jgi:hypothetical protein
VSLAVKPVGEPDARNPHVRFDERGWETGRPFLSVPAPVLDSTQAHWTVPAACLPDKLSGNVVLCFLLAAAHRLLPEKQHLFASQLAQGAVESNQRQSRHLSEGRQVGVRPLLGCELIRRRQGSQLDFDVV